LASFYEELKRRHVFKVAAAYAMVAWLLVQVIVAVEAPLDLPDWSDTAVIVALTLGFPVAIVLAWVFDVTAKGVLRTSSAEPPDDDPVAVGGKVDRWSLGIAAAAAVMLVVSTSYVFVSSRTGPIRTIAVLPFENSSNDPATLHLGSGISNSLIMHLSRIPELRVKSRSAIRSADEDIQTLGRLLGVSTICFGRLEQRGDSLLIAAELVDTSDGSVLWSEQFNRQTSGLLTIERDISTEIAKQLRFRLSGEQQDELVRAATSNPAAHDLYLQGRYFWNRRTEDGLQRSVDLFRRAIELDPDYALAWSGLADAYLMLLGWSIVPPADAAPLVVEAAERAIALDPRLAEPHAALGYLKTMHEWDWAGAEREFLRAIELNPNYSSAHHWYAFLLMTVGDTKGAIAEIEIARDSEPLSPIINAELGYFYLFARQYDRALQELEVASRLDPAYASTVAYRIRADALGGRRDDALANVAQWRGIVGDDLTASAYGGMVLPMLGLDAEARKIYVAVLALRETRYVMPALPAVLAAALGDHDAAFRYFDEAIAEKSLIASWLRDPLLDPIRDDPRFIALFDELGLEP
jgi:serine/threonine-protein kinase